MGALAKIDLIFPKDVYVPGEEINGTVFFASTKKIECKGIKVTFKGELQSKGYTMRQVTKSKKSRVEHIEKFVIHNEEKEISQTAAFDPGEYKLEFNFTIPEHSKISYEGHQGYVRYSISVKMEISRIRSNKARKSIKIVRTRPKAKARVRRDVVKYAGVTILGAEIDTRLYCIGEDITLRYLVNTDMNFNVLRIEVWHNEVTTLPDKGNLQRERPIWYSAHIRSEDVIRYEWQTLTLNIDEEFPPFVSHSYIRSELYLKFILGRSFRLDKVVRLPLLAYYCPKRKGPSDPDDVIPIREVRPRPARLRCKNCSYTFKTKEEDEEFATCPSCGKDIFF
ncbi:MAG: hypothetical protein ACW98U_02240 [Candidatus Thorarchaeota archaeon]